MRLIRTGISSGSTQKTRTPPDAGKNHGQVCINEFTFGRLRNAGSPRNQINVAVHDPGPLEGRRVLAVTPVFLVLRRRRDEKV